MKSCIPPEIAERLRKSLKNGEISPDTIAQMLPDEKKALKAILEGVVAQDLGITVSSEEIAKINELSQKIDKAQQVLGAEIGNPNMVKENVEFFKAKKAMDDYLMSRTPANQLKVLTGTVGRGMMLFSVKSPVLNIGSNIEIGFTEALTRRITTLGLKGADNKLAVQYVKMVNKIYQETGYDISRMTKLEDNGAGGSRVLGETVHAQGKGKVRKVGRFIEDVVFKQLMGTPDVAFSSAHFADSVNLSSLKLAKGNKASEVMLDSMRLEPHTPEGLILRNQGILDAQKATWTDTSWASRVSEGVRKILNDVSGDVRAGDYLLPFIKTPANVVATGMDYAGLGVPKAFFKLYKGMKNGNLGEREVVQSITKDLVRSGLGLVGALLIASKLDDDDFVGAYDPARAQIESLRNSNYNAIRIGNKWISTDWLGALSIPVVAMMNARKYGKTGAEKTFQYSKGVLESALTIPGVEDVYDAAKTNAYKKNQSLEEMTGETVNYLSSQVYSRLIPSFFSDVAKAVDPKVRQSVKGVESIKSKIPFLSMTLAPKTNIFGEEIMGEPAISDILFGARVKTDKETELVKEIVNVANANDKGISFTDWDKSSAKKLGQFKQVVGEKDFAKAKAEYGQELKTLLEDLVSSTDYEDMTDEEKLNAIRNQDTKAQNTIFDSYGFEYDPDLEVTEPKKQGFKIVKEAMAWGEEPAPEDQKRIDDLNAQIDTINFQLKKSKNSKLVSPVDVKALEAQKQILSGKALAIMTGTEKVVEVKKPKPPTQTPFNRDIENVFGDEWVNATRVLKRVDDNGKVVGENVQLKTGTEVDVKNSNGSIDRGLFRINSINFTPSEMNRRKAKLAKAGITSWDDMLDPALNIKMAKIIYDERGWDPWYAAPADIISDKERARRIRLGIPLMSKIKKQNNIG